MTGSGHAPERRHRNLTEPVAEIGMRAAPASTGVLPRFSDGPKQVVGGALRSLPSGLFPMSDAYLFAL